jgi:hypothetical protein
MCILQNKVAFTSWQAAAAQWYNSQLIVLRSRVCLSPVTVSGIGKEIIEKSCNHFRPQQMFAGHGYIM